MWIPRMNSGIIPFPRLSVKFRRNVDSKLRDWYSLRWKFAAPLSNKFYGTKVSNGEMFILIPCAILILIASVVYFFNDELGESGKPPSLTMGLAFFLACHNSLFTLITGIPFERALAYHKFLGYLSLITALLHGGVYWRVGDEEEEEESSKISVFGVDHSERAFSGLLLTIVLALIILTSFTPIRRYFFNAFYRFHWILFIAVIPLALIHGAGGILFGCVFWMVDVLYRIGYQALNFYELKAKMSKLPADVVKLTFPKNKMRYKGGQYMFICVPEISVIEWHPFSISSSPHHDEVSLHIRVLGDWTKKLYDSSSTESREINVLMEGPYGELSVDLDGDKYKSVVLISGGIGITPMQSIYNDLLYQFQKGRPFVKCWFVWAVRDKFMIDAVYDKSETKDRLPYSFTPDGVDQIESDNKSPFHTEFYLTKARNESEFRIANIRPNIQSYLRFGRPDCDQILNAMSEIAAENNEERVAVLVCGPKQMVQAVGKKCLEKSEKKVVFDFHSETFEF